MLVRLMAQYFKPGPLQCPFVIVDLAVLHACKEVQACFPLSLPRQHNNVDDHTTARQPLFF
jgi:hypothetical protein